MLFGAVIGLIAVWLIFDAKIVAPPLLPDNRLFLLLAGLVFGVVMAYAVIEARTPYVIVAMIGVLGRALVLANVGSFGCRVCRASSVSNVRPDLSH